MKKIVAVLLLLLPFAVFASGNYFNSSVNYANYLHDARKDYSSIHKVLDKTAEDISKNGEAAFKNIKAMNDADNEYNIFVIDAATGKLAVSPSAKEIGSEALLSDNVNGKALAKEAIHEAMSKLTDSPWDRWTSFVGALYENYFTKVAITDTGKVYVLAIGKNDLQLQHLFVEKIVNQACEVIEQKGIKPAMTIFDKKDGIFNFKDNYIYVYHVISDSNVVEIYNPNYPETIGTNQINDKCKYGYTVKDMLNYEHDGQGWVKTEAKVPGTKGKTATKHLFIKFINSDGQKYIVGSGVYLYDQK